ncbi:MAG: hypothetical protein GWN13_20000, partial [Phycisphaerae bacterium]|nr:hypothetical protein [Phycisphaerae bacterium]
RIDSLHTNQDSLSRDQSFTVQANIANIGAAGIEPNDTVWVEIEFDPANFQLAGGEVARKSLKLINNTAIANWQMRTTQTANFGNRTFSAFIDSVSSFDQNSDSLAYIEKVRDFHTVTILDPGQVAIESLLFQRNLDDSLVVSTDQSGIHLKIKGNISSFFASAQATLTLPSGAGFSTDSSLTKGIRSDSTAQWFITAPSQKFNWQQLKVKLEAESNINPEIVLTDSEYVYIRVINKANLLVTGSV